jgi:hypothetical protein
MRMEWNEKRESGEQSEDGRGFHRGNTGR